MKSTFNLAAGILTVSILLFTACSDDSSNASSSAPEYKEYANLKEALSDISSIKNVQTIKAAPFFNEAYELQFRQPISHNDTAGERDHQRDHGFRRTLSQINHSTGIFRKHEKETFCINIRIAANIM